MDRKRVMTPFVKGSTKIKGQAATKRNHQNNKAIFSSIWRSNYILFMQGKKKLGNTYFKALPPMWEEESLLHPQL